MSENDKTIEVKNYDVYQAIDMAYKDWLQNGNNTYYNTITEYINAVNLNNNPKMPTRERLNHALLNYTQCGELLSEYNEFMYTIDGILNRAINRLVNMLAFNWDKYCINAKGAEYSSIGYKEDEKRLYNFFDNFNIKQEFKIVAKNLLLHSEYFCWLRDSSGDINSIDDLDITKTRSYSLQMMPQDRCKITGKWTDKGCVGYLWDFDLNYFNNANVNIINYDPSIIKLYNKKIKENKLKSYTTNPMENNRTNGMNYDGFARTEMSEGAYAFKFDTSNFNSIPPFAYLLKSILSHEEIEKFQKIKDQISSVALVLGEIKTKTNEKSAPDKSPFTIEPKAVVQLNRQASRSMPENVKLAPMPTQENKLFQFADNSPHMYDNRLKTSAGLSAAASSMVYNNGSLGQFEMQSALNEDFQFISSIYPQFESFLNYYANKKTKKYKFRITVSGSTIPFIEKEKQDQLMKLSDKGVQVNVSKWASVYGMQPQELEAMMDEMYNGDTKDKLMLLLNSNTNNFGETAETGRPETDSESANKARDYNG